MYNRISGGKKVQGRKKTKEVLKSILRPAALKESSATKLKKARKGGESRGEKISWKNHII